MSSSPPADSPSENHSSRFSQGLAIAASLFAVTVLNSPSNAAVVIAVAGAMVLAFGVLRGNRRNVNRGSALQFGAVVLAGIEGVSPGLVLVGTASILIAWDVARYGIVLATQLGIEPDTTRVELVHATYSVGIAIGGVALVYGTYQLSVNTTSVAGFTLILTGVFALTAALR